MFYEVETINGEACITGLSAKGLAFIYVHNGQMPEFPLEFDGLPVTRIDEYAFTSERITKLPESWGNITTLEKGAFAYNKISQLPTDWGIVSEIGGNCFESNSIETIPGWGIIQKIGSFAFAVNRIEKIDNWGDLRIISKGTFCANNISELNASFRNIELIESSAFVGNNILSEIGDMYMVSQVEIDVFNRNPGGETLFEKYLNENENYRQAAGELTR